MQQQIQTLEQEKLRRTKHLEYLRHSHRVWLDEQQRLRPQTPEHEQGEERTKVGSLLTVYIYTDTYSTSATGTPLT